jgi:hypothetical protein
MLGYSKQEIANLLRVYWQWTPCPRQCLQISSSSSDEEEHIGNVNKAVKAEVAESPEKFILFLTPGQYISTVVSDISHSVILIRAEENGMLEDEYIITEHVSNMMGE